MNASNVSTKWRRLAAWTAAGLFVGCSAPSEDRLLVFAAASLRDVLHELEGPFESSSGIEVHFNFAGSNTLALQIEASGRGDLFLSADERWMDYLDEALCLVPGSRRTFLSNRLVLVAHEASSWQLSAMSQLPRLPFEGLAMADPAAVPAGRYARRYLESLPSAETLEDGEEANLWQRVAPRVVPALDVRAALALVEAEERILGLVYRSDALSSQRVRILYEVTAEEGPDIRYVASVLAQSSKEAEATRFLGFLEGDTAEAAFLRHGFEPRPAREVAGALNDHG